MVFWRRAFAYFLMFTTLHAYAGALPVSAMQNTLSGVIQQKAVKRGFAANDPRFGATLDLVSGVAGSAAAGAATVALAGLTAPAWVTGAIAFGIGAVVTYGVSLAVDGGVKWLFGDKGDAKPITRTKDGAGPPQYGGVVAGQPYWRTDGNFIAADPFSVAQAWFSAQYASTYSKRTDADFYLSSVVADGADYVYSVDLRNRSNGSITVGYARGRVVKVANSPITCPGGQVGVGGACVTPAAYPDNSPAAQPLKMTAQDAINELSAVELAKPANPALIASMADKLWRDAAAQPGYNGLPYSAADPVTATEVDAWRAANPESYPTVQDMVKPQVSANSPWSLPRSPSPVATQDTSLNPSAGTNPAASNPLQNLGPDPGIGAPTLEQTPTAAQILKPVLDLMPGFKSFEVSSGGSQCPKPEFDALGQHYVVDSHCGLLEQNRALLAAVMAAVWTLASVIVVLRA